MFSMYEIFFTRLKVFAGILLANINQKCQMCSDERIHSPLSIATELIWVIC